jgi:hypothetical protein
LDCHDGEIRNGLQDRAPVLVDRLIVGEGKDPDADLLIACPDDQRKMAAQGWAPWCCGPDVEAGGTLGRGPCDRVCRIADGRQKGGPVADAERSGDLESLVRASRREHGRRGDSELIGEGVEERCQRRFEAVVAHQRQRSCAENLERSVVEHDG